MGEGWGSRGGGGVWERKRTLKLFDNATWKPATIKDF